MTVFGVLDISSCVSQGDVASGAQATLGASFPANMRVAVDIRLKGRWVNDSKLNPCTRSAALLAAQLPALLRRRAFSPTSSAHCAIRCPPEDGVDGLNHAQGQINKISGRAE